MVERILEDVLPVVHGRLDEDRGVILVVLIFQQTICLLMVVVLELLRILLLVIIQDKLMVGVDQAAVVV